MSCDATTLFEFVNSRTAIYGQSPSALLEYLLSSEILVVR